MCSLAAVAIISKKHLTNYPWADLAAFAVPIAIALYFRKRVVLFGVLTYATALILLLGSAVIFGI
jgi:hypothetical protein